jgi:putative FmdB family regulatory protein
MPIYTRRCTECQHTYTTFHTIITRNTPVPCPKCLGNTERIIEAPAVHGDYAGYTCPITNAWIEGRAAHEANLAKHGCRVYEAGETREAQRRKASEDEAFLESVAESAARSVMQMPDEKRVALAKELDAGADVQYTRTVT